MKNKRKIVTAEEAVSAIKDGATVATGGFVGIGVPEEIAVEDHGPANLYGCPHGSQGASRQCRVNLPVPGKQIANRSFFL